MDKSIDQNADQQKVPPVPKRKDLIITSKEQIEELLKSSGDAQVGDMSDFREVSNY